MIGSSQIGGDFVYGLGLQTMWKQKKFVLTFSLVVATLVANALMSYRAIHVLIDDHRLATRTHEVLASLASTISLLKDAETGQRGFIITGDERFLEPYQAAISQIAGEMSRFAALTADDPDQQRRGIEIKWLVANKLAELQETIDLRKNGQVGASLEVVLSGRGQRLMDSVRRITAEAEAEGRARRAQSLAEVEAGGRRALFTFGIVNLLAFAFVGLTFHLNRRELNTRERAHARLQEANDNLERRVQERTAQLTAMNMELERSNRELQDFAFVASHDLQEPLRKIQAFGDLLKTEYQQTLGEEGRDFVERMQAASGRMNTLINDLLTFSRVTTRAQPFTLVDLTKVAQEVLRDLETRVQQTGGRVEIGALPEIEADPLQMRQLLQNLIGNALKFYRPGVAPIVKLDSHCVSENDEVRGEVDGLGEPSEAANGFCQIAVTDNGIGFEEKYLDRIFTPFQRLHGRSEYEGTGMGLSVCRKIVERHGGAITARSQPGVGSAFLITLPIKHSEGENTA
jgi:signal transduction histidine kinase